MWVYALACVLVPAAWGVLIAYVFSALDRRRRQKTTAPQPPPVDYSI